MKILNKIQGFFSESSSPGNSQRCVVDAAALANGGRDRQKLSPKNQIEILQNLSRIVRSENFEMEVVYEGKPLNKVNHGKKFDDIRVFFAKDADQRSKMLWTRARKTGGIVITENRSLEERLQKAGFDTMRISTFRKTFDRDAISRKRQRQPSRKPRSTKAENSQTSETNKVDDLIDLVE